MQNFRTLGQPLLGEKLPEEIERRERENKQPLIADTTFRLQRPRAAHALHLDQYIKIYSNHIMDSDKLYNL